MRIIATIACATCLAMAAGALTASNAGANGNDCEKKMTELSLRLDEAMKNRQDKQMEDLEKALKEADKQCTDRTTAQQPEGVREKFTKMKENARTTLAEWRENAEEGISDLKGNMQENLNEWDKDLDAVKVKIKNLKERMDKAIADGAESETVVKYKEKLKKAYEELQEMMK